jgi:hypothetical protein
VNAELVGELEVPRRTSTWRARAISCIGPLTALAAVGWALVQPYRITLLHPHGEPFWFLVIEPPLLVIAVGLFFRFFIAPGLLEDLEEERAAAR